MSDIRDLAYFLRSRWDWTRFGYERGFPRGSQFTDLDAAVEFDGHRLVIETKHYDGEGLCALPVRGQLRFLEDEARLGKAVFVLYGCGVCNDPYVVYDVGAATWHDWRGEPRARRRRRLKALIDGALGVGGAATA